MQTNLNLIREVRDEIRYLKGISKVHQQTRDAFATLLERYERACSLSRGPDAGRSASWTARAQRLEFEIRRCLRLLRSGEYRPVDVGGGE